MLLGICYTACPMKVDLFITCLADSYYPRTGIAVVKILEHLGHEVCFPKEQTCCGQPMFNTGYKDDTRKIARKMIDVFADSDIVVTPSGSCAAMVHENFEVLFEDDPVYLKKAKQLAAKTHEFILFLTDVLKVDLNELGVQWQGKATYHYSCHLRGIGVEGGGKKIVDVIKQVDGLEYVQIDKPEQCCGFGGTFAMKYPQISGSMVEDKVGCIKKTEADFVICNDAGCTMNISGSCERHDHDVKFITLAEIIAEGLGLLEKENV